MNGAGRAVVARWGLVALLAWLIGWPLAVTFGAALASPGGWGSAFVAFAERGDEWLALGRSLWISAATVLLAALLGVPLAFLFARAEFPGRRVLAELVALPVALPPLVGVIAFLYLYGESGLATRLVGSALGTSGPPWRLSGAGAILLVHAYSMYVYFYLMTRAALARFDGSLLEAAASLGAGARRRFLRVTLPALRPALAAAAILTFLTALGSFSAPYLFGGSFRVMTTQILASKQNGDLDLAEVETVVLAALAIAGLLLVRRFEAAAEPLRQRGVPPARRRSPRPGVRALQAFAGWALSLVLLAPHLTLVVMSFVPRASWTSELLPPVYSLANWRALGASLESLRPIGNSLWMATVATAGALALGFAAARLAARRDPAGRTAELLLGLPWAVPATAFAVALATTWSVDRPLAGRLVLVGTSVLLPLAYLIRVLPSTGRAALAGLAQLDPGLEEAARSLGANKLRVLGRVVLPMLRPALAAGAALAFIAACGDFVLSIVLYTFDTRPIAIEILSSLRLQETGLAAVYGVLLTALSAVAFLGLARQRES